MHEWKWKWKRWIFENDIHKECAREERIKGLSRTKKTGKHKIQRSMIGRSGTERYSGARK